MVTANEMISMEGIGGKMVEVARIFPPTPMIFQVHISLIPYTTLTNAKMNVKYLIY